MTKITAAEGYIFRRIYDQVTFGSEIYLGVDYSTGVAREDLPEYYEEINDPDNEDNSREILNIILGNDE